MNNKNYETSYKKTFLKNKINTQQQKLFEFIKEIFD